MSGSILIVDSVATNRIVLKVKLSAAYFRVTQAGSAAEALAQITRDRPQVVILSHDLPDGPCCDLIGRIHARPGCERLPVLVLCQPGQRHRRLALLEAGAAEVLEHPYHEQVLLARVRALSRQMPEDGALGLQMETVQALGLAEAPAGFAARGHVAALPAASPRLQARFRALSAKTPHRFETFQMATAGALRGLSSEPDVVLVPLGGTDAEHGLARLAELKSAPRTRHARLLVLLDAIDTPLAATVLDMGADDIATTEADPRELDLRLRALIQAKQAEDSRKARLRTGLNAAVTDPLTGLYNRRYAMARMARLTQTAEDSGDSFAVLLADLDHFKSVNDTFGHAIGDQVLAHVARTLEAALRPGDSVSRIGGEEFLFLLPGTDRRSVRDIADRLCRLVRETPFILPGSEVQLPVTVSIGATIAEPGTRADAALPERLLAQADRALYAAKSDGRDTVTIAQLSAA